MTKPANLRETMPQVSAFIDDMRAAFGADVINAEIRKGINGVPGFWASENGVEVGTRAVERGTEVDGTQMVLESIAKLVPGKRK